MAANTSKYHSGHKLVESIFVHLNRDQEEFRNFQGYMKKGNIGMALVYAVRLNSPEKVKEILANYKIPEANKSRALTNAAHGGLKDIVQIFIDNMDVSIDNSKALMTAAFKNHVDIVKMLLPYSHPELWKIYDLDYALFQQNPEMNNLLIPLSNPKVVAELKASGAIKESIVESIFVPLTPELKKERQDIYFSKLDRDMYDLSKAADINWVERIVELLVTEYAKPDVIMAEQLGSVLRKAAVRNQSDIARIMISYIDGMRIIANEDVANIFTRDIDTAFKIASNYGFKDIVHMIIPYTTPSVVNYFREKGLISESIFNPITSMADYEDRRNHADADLIFVLINDADMLGQTDNTRRKFKFHFSGSIDEFWYFDKRIPYKGHKELANMIMDEINKEAGRNIVQKWYIRGNKPS